VSGRRSVPRPVGAAAEYVLLTRLRLLAVHRVKALSEPAIHLSSYPVNLLTAVSQLGDNCRGTVQCPPAGFEERRGTAVPERRAALAGLLPAARWACEALGGAGACPVTTQSGGRSSFQEARRAPRRQVERWVERSVRPCPYSTRSRRRSVSRSRRVSRPTALTRRPAASVVSRRARCCGACALRPRQAA
jgi:hypothetical protein